MKLLRWHNSENLSIESEIQEISWKAAGCFVSTDAWPEQKASSVLLHNDRTNYGSTHGYIQLVLAQVGTQ